MKKTIEQIRKAGEETRKTLKQKEDRAMLKFAKAVLHSATSRGAQLTEQEILDAVAEAAGRTTLPNAQLQRLPDPDLHL